MDTLDLMELKCQVTLEQPQEQATIVQVAQVLLRLMDTLGQMAPKYQATLGQCHRNLTVMVQEDKNAMLIIHITEK